jgi:hypothetical protein
MSGCLRESTVNQLKHRDSAGGLQVGMHKLSCSQPFDSTTQLVETGRTTIRQVTQLMNALAKSRYSPLKAVIKTSRIRRICADHSRLPIVCT